MTPPFTIVLYTLIPMAITMIGGIIAIYKSFHPKLVNGIQYLTTGVILAAIAVDFIPKILDTETESPIVIGFILGTIAMLCFHQLAHFISEHYNRPHMPLGLLSAGAIDLFMDGFLIGISFVAGKNSGLLIAVSLGLCAVFFILALATTLTKKNLSMRGKWIAILSISLLIPIGAWLGGVAINSLPMGFIDEALAFGIAALLFLSAEEVLGEAHRTEHNVWTIGSLFLGFLMILLFKVHFF